MLSPPPFPDATTTASIELSGQSDIFPGISSWAPRELPTQPVAATPPSDLREDKTERLDDVIEKLRQQSAKGPLPPLEPPAAPRPSSSPGRTLDMHGDDATHVSMAPASNRTSPMAPTPHRSGEKAPAPRRKPARRLVVYGEPPGAIVAPPPAAPRDTGPALSAPPVSARAAAGLRRPSLRVGLIVAAIVVLFAAVLFVLVALVRRGAAGETPRGSRGGSSAAIAAAA